MADANSQPWLDIGTLLEGDLFDVLGLTDIPEERQDEMRLMVMESIRDRVLVRIVKILGPQKEAEFLALLDQDTNNQEVDRFLEAADISLVSLVAEEAFSYKIDLAQRLGILKEE